MCFGGWIWGLAASVPALCILLCRPTDPNFVFVMLVETRIYFSPTVAGFKCAHCYFGYI